MRLIQSSNCENRNQWVKLPRIEGQIRSTYIAGQTFILFHETLILLVHLQHFTNTIGSSFGLIIRGDAMWKGKKIFDRLIEITIQVDSRFVILVDTNIPNYWGHIQENTFHRCVYVYICTYRFILVCSKKMRRGDQNGIQKHCVSVNFLHWAAYTVSTIYFQLGFFLWYDSCTIKIPFELH